MNPAYKRVSIHWVKAILAAAQSLGIEPHTILSDLKLPLDLDNNRPAYLSLDQTQDIWQKAESLSGHDFFGLSMGQMVRPAYFHAVSYVAMTSRNLIEAYENFVHYMPLLSEGAVMEMAYEGQNVWIRFTPKPDTKPFSRHQHESVVALLLAFSRWLTGDDLIKPTQLHLSHAAGPNLTEYKKVFDLTPQFEMPFTQIQFLQSQLLKPLAESDVGLNALHKAHADQLMAAHQNTSWKAKVVQIIVSAGHFDFSREKVAEKLNVSTRTLQRRLQEEGCSFLEVMDAQRKQKAEELICRTHKSLKEVAQDLGFAEASTFYRACHRWFGNTPLVIRQQAQADE